MHTGHSYFPFGYYREGSHPDFPGHAAGTTTTLYVYLDEDNKKKINTYLKKLDETGDSHSKDTMFQPYKAVIDNHVREKFGIDPRFIGYQTDTKSGFFSIRAAPSNF